MAEPPIESLDSDRRITRVAAQEGIHVIGLAVLARAIVERYSHEAHASRLRPGNGEWRGQGSVVVRRQRISHPRSPAAVVLVLELNRKGRTLIGRAVPILAYIHVHVRAAGVARVA